jgi:AhpD family alkylhydroperoxidase
MRKYTGKLGRVRRPLPPACRSPINPTQDKEKAMQPRLHHSKIAHDAYRAMLGMERYLRECSLDRSLLLLVQLRASQINGCAFCIDMHYKDARAAGESEQRLYALAAWRDSPSFTDRERAALAWTEEVTRIAETHASDAVYEAVRPHFSDRELVDLTWAVAAINAWNRIAIAFRDVPGAYQPAHPRAAGT